MSDLTAKSDLDLAKVIDNHRRGLVAAELEQKRREEEASKSYGEREAEKIVTGDSLGGYIVFNLDHKHIFKCADLDRNIAVFRRHLADHIDAARRDAFEQAAKVVEQANRYGSVQAGNSRQIEFIDREAVAARIRELR